MAAGDTSYFGFEYQIYASAFLMLIEHRNLTFSEISIETPFGHDAAILSNESTAPGSIREQEKSLNVSLSSGNKVKQVQVKTKVRHYMWHSAEFRKVLLKQDEGDGLTDNAQTVLDQLLSNPQEIFIFFTDGVVHPDLASLRADPIDLHRKQPNTDFNRVADSIINSTRDPHIKTRLQSLKAGILERIFIIESLDMNVLRTRICDIIYKTYGIPYHQCAEKMQGLVDLVRKSMLRENGKDRVTLRDLEKVVGPPTPKAPYPELIDNFVPIPEYNKALESLEQEHVVIICGEPCVGKTTVARALVNTYYKKNYECTLLPSIDAHLHVATSCMKNETRIFLVDDGLGVMNYENQLALADQIPQLILQIKHAKGRIKLIITTRRNVLAEAKSVSRLGNTNIDRHIVNISPPNTIHLTNVLNKLLSDLSDEDKYLIQFSIPISRFENLAHVRHFVDELRYIQAKDTANIGECFELSRPSEYRKWIQKQSSANQLCLVVLWMLVETNGFVTEDNLKRIYTLAEDYVQLPASPAFGNWLDESLLDLVRIKNRIERVPNGTLDFIHPHLRNAVKEFLCNGTSGIFSFLGKLSTRLANIEHPLEQSIASMLCLLFRKQLGVDADHLINKLLNSRFVQTIETVIRFGGVPLVISLLDNDPDKDVENNTESKIDLLRKQFLYSPGQCRLDENGHLVKKRDTSDNFVLSSEITDDFWMEWGPKSGQLSEQKRELFTALLKQRDFGVLNPLERYEFAYWLYHNRDTAELGVLLDIVKNLANDSISFIRETAAIFIDQETLVSSPEYNLIFQNLCYDGHPNVKIEMLEQVILRNWRFAVEETREEWLRIVADMLDDPIVRLRSSMGLIDQSGSLAHYHENHSLEQKQKWFIALAPKLLQHGFTHQNNFDRFLTPVDKWFVDLPISFRTKLLRSIADYIEKKNSLSQDTIYSIEKIVLEGNLTWEENDICLRLISNLSSWGKSRICYTFANKISALKDVRFRQFVYYPFYNESETQFIAERVAALLGFRASSSVQLSDLPTTICKDNTRSVADTLNEYYHQQNDNFKLLSVMMAYGYGLAYHTGAVYDDCFRLDIIDKLIIYFSKHNDLEKVRVVAEIILNKIYLWNCKDQDEAIEDMSIQRIKESEWFRRLELFLYNQNPRIGRCVCEVIFASNIASSAHNVKIFLFLVYLLLNHPDKLISDYAFVFFDKYFYEIKKVMFDRNLPSSWQKEISDTWFKDEFQSRLLENSTIYKEWLQYTEFFKTLGLVWPKFPEDIRDKVISSVQALVSKDRPELTEILRQFYYEIQDSMSDKQKELLKNSLGIQHAPHIPDILTEKYIESREELNSFFAKVDWIPYFGP